MFTCSTRSQCITSLAFLHNEVLSMFNFHRVSSDVLITQKKSHLFHFEVDAPDDKVVGRLFTGKVRVFKQVFLTVVVFPQHSKLLYLLLIILCKLLLHTSTTKTQQ